MVKKKRAFRRRPALSLPATSFLPLHVGAKADDPALEHVVRNQVGAGGHVVRRAEPAPNRIHVQDVEPFDGRLDADSVAEKNETSGLPLRFIPDTADADSVLLPGVFCKNL